MVYLPKTYLIIQKRVVGPYKIALFVLARCFAHQLRSAIQGETMSHPFRLLLLIALIFVLPQSFGVQAAQSLRVITPPAPTGPTAPNAAAWYDGAIQYSTITNCVSIIQGFPYQEYGAGVYTGFLADPDAGQPSPNTTYYVHVYIAGLGNPCSGGVRAYIDIALPASTSLAIDAGHPVYCFYDGAPISPASQCPQSLPASSYNPGAYAILSADTAHVNTWPIPQGHTLEIQVPVKSSVALTNSILQANVWTLDGNSSPWLRPQQGVYVFSSQPTIVYPSPSTTAITATTAHSQVYLYTFNTTGTGYFDLGTTISYGLVHEAAPISTPGTAWLVFDDWGPPPLTPDTLYHWRFTFTASGGQTYVGLDQTFRTLPDGRVTIGQGLAADCSETAFNAALTTAKEIVFNCGALPVTITLNSAHSITTNLTINGGNKITLASNGSVNHFNVQSGGNLNLSQITLSDGSNTLNCGGSIKVFAGAQLSLNETRFVNNHSNAQGGAICNFGSANISTSLFTGNVSLSHGGAIGNYGSLIVTNSKFLNNTATYNGGGIDMGGNVTVTNSAFTTNTGLRGGGINTYGGTLNITGSSFTGNTANLWGGGLANDASFTTVSGSTFSGNTSANFGGGIETSGIGSLTLTNTTLSANHATTEGGGLYWYPGVSTGPVTILNTTIAGNLAGTQGGSIYAGGAANSTIYLKNTIVASGSPNNCDNPISSQGNNLESTNSCGLAAAGDKINLNPKLSLLQDNGGATLTHTLLFGSPAIDAGTNSGCPAADQRSITRPLDGNRDGSSVCDIGAVEVLPQWPVFLPLTRK
jgi:predicted outer membrane repeat protein